MGNRQASQTLRALETVGSRGASWGGSLRIVGIFNLPHLVGPGPPVLNHRGWGAWDHQGLQWGRETGTWSLD